MFSGSSRIKINKDEHWYGWLEEGIDSKERAVSQLSMFMWDLSAAPNNLSKAGIFDVVKLWFAMT